MKRKATTPLMADTVSNAAPLPVVGWLTQSGRVAQLHEAATPAYAALYGWKAVHSADEVASHLQQRLREADQALQSIADMDPLSQRGDDLGRAAWIARSYLSSINAPKE